MLRNHVKTLYTFTFFYILKCNEISIASAQNQFYILILFTTLIYMKKDQLSLKALRNVDQFIST